MPVFLWTDALLYLLIAGIGVFIFLARRHKPLRDPWLRVLGSRMGMASLVVLLAFATVGIMDSVHFRPAQTGPDGETRYSARIVSLLDVVAGPLAENNEQTYSAPFATHGYVQQVITDENGDTRQVYPRLEFGGAHLDLANQSHAQDILIHGLAGAARGLAVWAVLAALLCLIIVLRTPANTLITLERIWQNKAAVRWRTALLTGAVIALTVGAVVHLAGFYHVLGTDKVGQDVLLQSVKSIRTGLLIGTLTTLVMLPFALVLGVMAGYFKGWVDDLIQYLYTTLSSIPAVLLIAAAVLMLQVYMENNPGLYRTTTERADLRLLFLCMILGITSWTGLCRLLRAETLKLVELDYVQAGHALGVSHIRIMARHIMPNVMHIVLIQIVLDFSALVLAEAVLSYIGVGVDPSTESWGNMINGARLEMSRDPVVWWPLAAAFFFMLVLVLAANLFADVVRDAFDPRLRGGRGAAEPAHD